MPSVSFKSLVKEYCSKCSFGGVHFIADDKRDWKERWLWAILVLLSWCGSALLISASWNTFVTSPISFGVETTYKDWDTKLPTVAVCETSNNDKIYNVSDTIWTPNHLLDLEDVLTDIAYFRGSAFSLIEVCYLSKKIDPLCPLSNYRYYASLTRSSCPQLIENCTYNNVEFDCCEYFQPIDTDFGTCYIINSIQTKNPKPYPMACNMKQKEGVLRFNVLLVSTIYTIGEDEVPTITTLYSSTFKLTLGKFFRRQVSMRYIENDPLLEETTPKQRACRFHDENEGGLYPYYSYSACNVKCRKKAQMDLCQCNDHFMLDTEESQRCNVTGMSCLHTHSSHLTTLRPPWAQRPGLNCECMPSCDETEITVIKDVFTPLKQKSKKTVVELVLPYLPTERFKRNVVRSRLDLVVSLGGAAGLFVGASLLSFVELIFFFTVRFISDLVIQHEKLQWNLHLSTLAGKLSSVVYAIKKFYKARFDNVNMSRLSVLGGSEACGARWTLGALLLAPLAAANSSYCAVLAVLLLSALITLATFTARDLKKLDELLPPSKTVRGRRERNLRSFADFMALWMSFLSHLVAVAVCARILSATADHVTGGRTRRWLFGYETRSLGEPWPDVLGVTVVMVVCAMFMCGLEESMMFTFMLLVVLYIFSQCFAIFGLINLDITNIKIPIPITIYELFTAAAPISYAFAVVLPPKVDESLKRKMLVMIVLPTLSLATLCFLYTNMLKGTTIDAALPVTTLLEARAAGWICPVLAAITVAGICLALTELCPLLFSVLVVLASPEWKVLTRSMTYESTTTGSPVLAVFTAGSLAAILAFACPLSHMITLMNASHLFGISIQAFHIIIMRCVPTAEQMEAGDIEYKRLGNEKPARTAKSSEKKAKRGLWFIPSAIRHTKTLESIKSKVGKDPDDRECLLLDEYSGCPTEEIDQASSGGSGSRVIALAEEEDVQSDMDASDVEISSGDDSTDIDAIVKEYKDRIQVVTAIPEARAASPPGMRGARWAAAGAAVQLLADAFIAVAFCKDTLRVPMFATGVPLWLCGVLLAGWQPAHDIGIARLRKIQGPMTLMLSLMLLTPLLVSSWPAIILFAGAGVVIYARCERWCGDLAVHHARGAVEKRRRHAAPAARLTHVDTVYIAR